MAQTAYSELPGLAVAGMLADNANYDIQTYSCEETTLEAGRPLVRGTAANQVLLPSGASDEFVGISVRRHQVQDYSLAGVMTFESGEDVGVLTKGRIWVTVEENVAAGDPVFWRHTANTGVIPGGWRNDADTDKAVTIASAKFETTATAGNLAIISINVP